MFEDALQTAQAQPTKPKRAPRGWTITAQERAQLGQVMTALWEARKAAGMAVGKVPAKVIKSHCGPQNGSPGFIGRLGELDDAMLLCAIVRARVAEQGKSDLAKIREGRFANGTTICRDKYWSSNLDGGRAWLASNVEAVPDVVLVDGTPLDEHDQKVWDDWVDGSRVLARERVLDARADRRRGTG